MDDFKMGLIAENVTKGQYKPPKMPCIVIEDNMRNAATKCQWMDDGGLTGAILLYVLDNVQKSNTIQRYYKMD